MKPAYRLTVNGQDISSAVNGRLKSLTLTDKRGMESDQLTLEIDDSDGAMAMPPKGAKIQVALGWSPSALVDKGEFVADEIGHSGPPDTLTIQARAADLRGPIKSQKSRSFHQSTLGAILSQVATDNGLTLVVSPDLAAKAIAHLDQTNESDMHLVTRLAQRYGALATVKEGRLLFAPAGLGQTIAGQSLPTLTIARRDGDSHHYQDNDRSQYTGVKATWYDPVTASKRTALAGEDGSTKTLSQRFPSEAEAQDAADATHQRLMRGKATCSLTLAVGNANIITESPVKLTGYKPEICAQAWVVSQVTHRLGDSGWTTEVELENQESP